jgi:hypothetical protein
VIFVVTAVLEAGTGLALVASPALPVWLLFGTALDTPTATAIARVAGAALLSLGVACWLVRHDAPSRAATGLTAAMLVYNIAVAALLAYAGLVSGLLGIGLWPGIVLHVLMAIWCLVCLRKQRTFDR